ncbi:DedA family protein [Candidatus Dojkabacteria bacterium]|uniref:DedA family protein n=1 Tax=Candidatus Dojkabacteria bacterium TaxID=2099670 RepID=A0A847EU49_9BACT|nr:DedA family protein [Candidatus Dojkabacteria bacterium]
MIQSIIDWLVNVISVLGYPGVFISVFLESFIAPIPSEIILPFSGFVASIGSMNIYLVIIVATLAAYLGSLPFYFIGRWGEKPVLTFLERYGKYLFIKKSDVDKGFEVFNKYVNGVVFVGRVIPIIRTLISFPAGVAKMNFVKFTIYTLFGSLIWNIVLTYTGFILGDHWERIGGIVGQYEKVIIVVCILLFILYVGRGVKDVLRSRVKK